MSQRRTEHKSLQGVTEQSAGRSAETKDITGPVDGAEPTVKFAVTNWTRDHEGKLLTPGDEPDLPVSLAKALAPVYGRILD